MSIKHLSLTEPKGALQPSLPGGLDQRHGAYSPYSYVNAAARAAMNERDDSVGQYWRILSRRKGTLLLATLLGALLAILFTLPQAPVYRAQTALEVVNLNDEFLNMKSVSPTANPSAFQSPEYNIRTQAAIL